MTYHPLNIEADSICTKRQRYAAFPSNLFLRLTAPIVCICPIGEGERPDAIGDSAGVDSRSVEQTAENQLDIQLHFGSGRTYWAVPPAPPAAPAAPPAPVAPL